MQISISLNDGVLCCTKHFSVVRSYFLIVGPLTILFTCMDVLTACMFVYHVCTWCWKRPEEGVESPRTEATNSCEFLCGYSE